MKRLALAGAFFSCALLGLARPAQATIYYVDWTGGNDANNGTSTSTPWQRAPGMNGFTGTYSHSGGDSFIFKGGVTWPNSAFPFTIAFSGASDSIHDYYGVDTIWFAGNICGASFCRPIFDLQNQVAAGNNDAIILSGVSNVTIDNLDIRDQYWTGNPASGQAVGILVGSSQRVKLTNLYIHAWTHNTAGSGTRDVYHAVEGVASGNNQSSLSNSEITDAPYGDSGLAVFNFPIVATCTIHDLSSGIIANETIVSIQHNYLFNINASFDGTTLSQVVHTTGVSLVFDNLVYNFQAATTTIMTTPSHNAVVGDDEIYNNVVWNTGSSAAFEFDTTGANLATANPLFANNTIVPDNAGYCLAIVNRGAGNLGALTLANNHCISDIAAANFVCTSAQDAVNCTDITTLAAAANNVMTHAAATAAAYTVGNFFAPTASNSPTVEQGVFEALVPQDIRGVFRPQGPLYDEGAYEFCSSAGCGPVSPPPVDTTPPSIPLNLTAAAVSSTRINLGWSSSIDVDSPVQGYVIYRGGVQISTSTTNFYFDTGLTAGTSYTYNISAYDFALNFSSRSLPASTTTLVTDVDTSSPTTPTGLTATAPSSILIKLSWTASTDPDSVVFGYNVYRGGVFITIVTTTTYSDNGLLPGTSYTYNVSAFDPAGNTSPLSAPVSATTQSAGDSTPPTVPTGLNGAAASFSEADLSWTASTDPDSAVSGYTIFRNGARAGSSTSTSFADTGLAAQSTYTYTVSAFDPSGNTSAQSSPITIVTPPAPPALSPRFYPSPWRSDQHRGLPMTIDGLSGICTIEIFTMSGHLVRSFSTSNILTTWDLKNNAGDGVASGLYFYVVTNAQGSSARGKFVIIQ